MKFRKKPVVIEAIQLLGTRKSIIDCMSFMDIKPDLSRPSTDMRFDDYCNIVENEGMTIPTLEGEMNASIGDWIIKGIKGEFYPCKPDVFAERYEKHAE